MKLRRLNEIPKSKTTIDIFGGYNHNSRINEGEFYDMRNLSSDDYPVMTPRRKRGVYASPSATSGIIAKDTLCYTDGSYFVMDNYRIDMGLSASSDGTPKQLISMGAYVIILPDKKYINTKDITDYGNIEASVTTSASVSFELTTRESEPYEITYKQTDEPKGTESSPIANGTYWLDLSQSPNVLKQWSESNGMWVQIPTVYTKISSTNIGKSFKQYDGVNISGLKGVTLYDTSTPPIAIEDAGGVENIDGNYVIWDCGDDYITIVAIISNSISISNAITVARRMPEMDFVIESENRLWGCRYGVANNGEVVNEIYASKLGDFRNWQCFMGLSTDSYTVSLGTDGQFTGAITHLGYPLFFKENCLHKVYGNMPSNYQMLTSTCRGVSKGSWRSLAIVNEVLYYKSRTGICKYDGSLPSEISYAFGEEQYENAVAGANGNKYYITMEDKSGEHHFFAYDASKGLWHKEDNTQADMFCSCRGEMYYIDHANKKIMTCLGSGTVNETDVEWSAETGVVGTVTKSGNYSTQLAGKKYISQFLVRMSLELGSRVSIYIQYDSMGEWEHITTMVGTHLRTFTVPVRPKRCDHFRLRFVGVGKAKIFSYTKTLEQGSDM